MHCICCFSFLILYAIGSHCRNILCFPIKDNTEGTYVHSYIHVYYANQSGYDIPICETESYLICTWKIHSTLPFFDFSDVVGVAELCNKVGGKCKCLLRYMHMYAN